jgi:polysaccharide pyruvyl transferase WcaK-like protein
VAASTVVVASWLGSTNLGDELLYAALVRQLATRGAAPVGISTQPAATSLVHGTGAIAHDDPRTWWRTLGEHGRMVFGGGGLLQDESSRLNVPYHLSRVAVARARRARIVGVGLGAGRLHQPSESLVRAAFTGVPVGVRDRATRTQLAALGLDVRLTADLVFSLPPPDVAARDELVVSLRPRNVGAGWLPASRNWRRGLPSTTQLDTIARRLGDLARALGLSLRFVALQADRDGPLHDALADRVSSVPVETVRPGVHDVLAEVARGRLVVGMRFHAAVAGMLAGRPVLAAAYSSKVAELAADAPASVRSLTRPLSSVAPEQAQQALTSSPDRRAEELAALVDRERGNGRLLDELLGP